MAGSDWVESVSESELEHSRSKGVNTNSKLGHLDSLKRGVSGMKLCPHVANIGLF